jgi:hypothetical protein
MRLVTTSDFFQKAVQYYPRSRASTWKSPDNTKAEKLSINLSYIETLDIDSELAVRDSRLDRDERNVHAPPNASHQPPPLQFADTKSFAFTHVTSGSI